MSNPDPTKPTSNGEKFKPQNMQDPVSTVEPPTANADTPSDTDGQDIPRGSEPDVKRRG